MLNSELTYGLLTLKGYIFTTNTGCYGDSISLCKLQAFMFIETPEARPNVGPSVPVPANFQIAHKFAKNKWV